jgi:ribosome biogenesis protein MAK21
MALDMLVELMAKKPEIEEVILSILINKLGDSSKKIQGHTIQVLCKLLKEHPQMAQIVIQETHSLLQRAGLKTA